MIGPNPFRALEAYTKDDREKFFGRDADLTLVLDRILTRRNSLLFAASGAGKTSFINARVVPELEDRFFVVSHNRWSGREPAALVLETVLAEWAKSPWSEGASPLPQIDGAGDGALVSVYAAMQPRKPWSGALLILDQFEEVFQQHGDTPGLASLVDSLAVLINSQAPDVRVLFSMREEFLGELSIFDNRIPDLFNNYYRLKNPSRLQARSIIVNTVRGVDVEPGPGLEALLDDLVHAGQTIGDSPERGSLRDTVPPPYLQIACHGLWEKQFPSGNCKEGPANPTFPAAYAPQDALAQLHSYCEGILKKLDDRQRNQLAEALGFLITRRGAKVAYEVSALAEHSEMPESELRALLDLLSAKGAKLFRRTEASDGSTWYELYHDMYAPFLTLWKTSHQKERRARVRRRVIFAGAAALLVASIAGFGLWRNQVLQAKVVQLQQRQLSTPLSEYRLRFGRHTDAVQQVVFSPDGQHLASVSLDHTAKIWNLASGLAELSIHDNGPLYSAAFNPNPKSSMLAVAGERGAVRLLDWTKGSDLREWAFGRPVYALAFDPSGGTLACGGDSNQLQLFPVDSGAKQSVPWKSEVNALLYLPGKALIVVDSAGEVVQLRNAAPSTFAKFSQKVVAVAASPDGKLVAAGGSDQIVHVFDVSGKTLFSLAGNSSSIWTVAISPDDKLLASGALDGTIRLWELEKGTQVATLLGHTGPVLSVVFDPAGKTLVSAGQDTTVRIWEVASRQQVSSLEGEWAPPKTVQFSADLTRIVTEGSRNKTQLWAGPQLLQEFDDSITAIAMTRDGRKLALGTSDGSVLIRPDSTLPQRSRPDIRLAAFDEPVRGVVFSGNSRVIAVLSHDARTVRVMSVPADSAAAPHSATSVPDTGELPDTTHQLRDEPAWFVALDEAGHAVALANEKRVAIFDRMPRGAPPLLLKRDTRILGISYNAFGMLTILYENGSVEVVAGGGAPGNLAPDNTKGKSTIAAVTEDGRSFAFAGNGGDIEVKAPWFTQPLHLAIPRPLLVIAFSRDGRRLGTVDETGTVRTYSVGPPDAGAETGSRSRGASF